MKTLLVIDMQNAWLANPAAPCFDVPDIAARINHAARCVRDCGGEVIFVQHADQDAIAGSDAWNIIAALAVTDADARVEKIACDSFADTDLGERLASASSGTLFVCGFATEFCVDTTVRAAASRALDIIVLSDAHTTSNRSHLDAERIIAHHNWVWSNMAVPANSTLTVTTTAQAFPNIV